MVSFWGSMAALEQKAAIFIEDFEYQREHIN
jgi:hypothetical protein